MRSRRSASYPLLIAESTLPSYLYDHLHDLGKEASAEAMRGAGTGAGSAPYAWCPKRSRSLPRSRNGGKDVMGSGRTGWMVWNEMDGRPWSSGTCWDPLGCVGRVLFAS